MTIEQAPCFASAVVYVRNDANTVADFITTLDSCMRKMFVHHEIVCVDDASTDDSAAIIRCTARKIDGNSLSTIRFDHFHGREIAMQSGVELAIGDFVFEFDNAVLNFDPIALAEAYRKAIEGHDIVGVSPVGKRKIASRLFYRAMKSSGGLDRLMDTETFRLLSRRAINRIKDMCQTVPYRKAVYFSCGLPTTIIACTSIGVEQPRQDKAYRAETAINALLLFTKIGYRIALGLTLFMMAAALFMIIYSFICYFAGITITGWMTTILFLSFAFFGLFGILAIVIKYLQIIVNLTFRKKNFAYECIERY